MRQFINTYGTYIILAAALVASVALYFHFHNKSGTSEYSNLAYYVDADTGEESVGNAAEFPPLMGKSGKPTLVQAIRVSCDGGKTSRIAFLQEYTPDAQAKLQTLPPDDIQRNSLMQNGLLVRRPESGSPWVAANGDEGQNIQQNVDCPAGATLSIVVPH